MTHCVRMSWPAIWILKCRGHGTLKSIVGHHDWPGRTFIKFTLFPLFLFATKKSVCLCVCVCVRGGVGVWGAACPL